MTAPNQLLALAAQAEAGVGEDRELDAEAALACGWTQQTPPEPDPIVGFDPYWRSPTGANISGSPPRLTSSLDAVAALIEERLPKDERIELTWDIGKQSWAHWDQDAHEEPWGKATTPARALLACCLRAIAQQSRPTEQEDSHDGG